MLRNFIRTVIRRLLSGQSELALAGKEPVLQQRFQQIKELGLYLHIPFCDQICPYCPYNKELYRPDSAAKYTRAVLKEIDTYADMMGKIPVTSFYIGGGTPTTMLRSGLAEVLDHVFKKFDMHCGIHMESHPNHLDAANLDAVASLGVRYLSIGVEALQDRHLRILKRPYTVKDAIAAVDRAVNRGFECVNADIMFALPGQTYAEVEEAGRTLVGMNLDQVSAYPLFSFPYTQMGKKNGTRRLESAGVLRRKRMLGILEDIFYGAGFERTSSWAFTRKGIPKYCSVTVPIYIGLGASGGSYLRDIFYLNTFSVEAYVNALNSGKSPIALSLDLSERMQRLGWLYWRIYETRFAKAGFAERFGEDFDTTYGRFTKMLAFLGLLSERNGEIVLSSKGAFWLHAFEDLFSIDYVGKLWGNSQSNSWPEKVDL
ncbi:MAG: radical SAM protein [Acidobacteria bacterium]|nr:radical SAM protein [Acidobacteriota bacterium]